MTYLNGILFTVQSCSSFLLSLLLESRRSHRDDLPVHVQNLECLLLDLNNDSNSLGINLDHVAKTVLTW